MDIIFEKVKKFAEVNFKGMPLIGIEELPSCWDGLRVFIPQFSRFVYIGDFLLIANEDEVRFSTVHEPEEYRNKMKNIDEQGKV